MARKDSANTKPEHGFGDIIGIVLVGLAVMMLVALFSYDRADLSIVKDPPNDPKHNLIGSVGAWLGFGLFSLFGATAFVMPVLALGFGLSYFLGSFAYLRQKWAWALIFLICCMGMLDLYSHLFSGLKTYQDGGSVGGFIGLMLNKYFFKLFGTAGATMIFVMLYAISLIFLTNFQVTTWFREWWQNRGEKPSKPEKVSKAEKMTDEEAVLEKRAKDLAKQAKKLQEEVDAVEKSGLGADMQPIPEPTIRDLSVPTARPGQAKPATGKAAKVTPELAKSAILQEGEVIRANEIVAAATVADILGQAAPLKEPEVKVVAAMDAAVEAPAAEPAVDPDDAPLPPMPLPKPRLTQKKPKPIAVASTPVIGNYQYPTLDFLHLPDLSIKPTESKEELMANARLMQNTLGQFGIEVALGDITKGPTITRYELHPAPGVRLEKITALSNNISAALKAERINILAPVPGKSSVGVEVPNLVKTKVIMRDLLESEEWNKTKARIPLALGKDVYGHPIIADLAEMPHLLIAGSTGSGKSVCINSIIASLLYKFSPEELRFVMIDPKVVELQQYNALPHLVVPVVNDPKKVILALRWVVNEMEKRYQIFAKVGVRNIKSFNERPKNKPVPTPEPELPLTANKEKVEAGADGFAVELDEEIVVPREDEIVIPDRLSYIVVIIDELADLMLVAPADVEMAIARITQMARAAGIHCIVATQRPSVDVITGVIKANIPARIAFQVAAKVDSRTILDAMGADKLLGKGDMLYLPPGSARLIRAQGVLITDQEIQSVVDHIAKQGKPSYELEIHQQLQKPASSSSGDESGCDEDEDLIQQCIEVIRSEQKASVSLMQRRLRLGYTRAARIMDELENRGIVGPSKGAEPRDILLDLDGGGADGRPPN